MLTRLTEAKLYISWQWNWIFLLFCSS